MWQITRDDVMLNWACSECSSPRWQAYYFPLIPPELFEKVRSVKKFERDFFTGEEREHMIKALVSYRHMLLDLYLLKTNSYRVQSFTKDKVAQFRIIHEMYWDHHPVSLTDFKKMPYDAESPHHPCAVSERMDKENALLFSGMPILMHDGKGENPLLIEGYTRCLSFMKHADASDQIWAYVCE